MRRVALRSTLVVAGAVLLVACSGDDSGDVATATTDEPVVDATEPDASSTTQSTAAPDATAGSTAAPATVPATTAPAATAPPTTPPAEPEPLLAGFDDLIELTVEPGPLPDRPVLSWTAVDGADHYGVYVYAPSGEIYWAWQGRDTSVPLGGAIGDAPGPLAAEGMTWAVIAYDAALLPITVSVVGSLVE